ncbi:hypothetical protein [Pseudoalteromonas sp. S1688]|uniref:hypothetical protein n=1 Tax=Pseudoalteromonas sp. S1688 TaxID=579511 RepID=UPI00110ABB4C|nr:hypothetical protein [Pseudoalteromonas sp. S1688]
MIIAFGPLSILLFLMLKGEDLGHVKIGYKGQAVPEVRSATYTASYLPPFFETLDDIFSVGQDVEYYKKLLTIAVELRVETLKIKIVMFVWGLLL